jgi:hypothetical protein
MDNIEIQPTELTHIIKLWLDEQNCGFWHIIVYPNHMFDTIELNHYYKALDYHDNESIEIRITIPHDTAAYKHLAVSGNYELGSNVTVSPNNPNFFEYLRQYINNAIITCMGDLHKKLASGLRYRGIYAKSSDNS